MHDKKGYHKIGNPTETPAVTMHVYSPPFKAASKIDMNGKKELCVITYDTEGGIPKSADPETDCPSMTMTAESCAPAAHEAC